MTSSAEKFGRALGKAVKGAADSWKQGEPAPVMYRTNLKDVPKVEGLKRDDGWVDMQVQFLIDKKTADADHVVGWTVLKPGARHENHRHHNCDEFFIVLKGHGMIYTDKGDTPSAEGDVVYSPRGCWHGFNNTSNEDVVLVWGWMGAGSIEASGYEVHPENSRVNAWEHPLIKKGMPAQLAKRRARIAAGERPLGWKVGLGAPASMQKVGIAAPIVGYLMQRALLLSGSTVSLAGWIRPVAEPEICVRMMSDLGGGATPDTALAAVKEIFPAIELADLDPLPTADNLDAVLEDDIFQRHVILCGNTRFGGGTAGLTSRVLRRGKEAANTSDPEALTGKLPDIVAHVANTLAAYGEKLTAGDVIITGSITPPIMLEPDDDGITHALDPIGEVSVNFSKE